MLVPSATRFTSSSLEPPRGTRDSPHHVLPNGEFRLGKREGPPDVRMLVGYCEFASTDASLLVGLLPRLVHVHGRQRLATLMQLVQEEFREQLPGREVILARLLEVLLIEALRATSDMDAAPGLLRGLADAQIAAALRCIHAQPSMPWAVTELAKEAGLSRSAFFERFSRALGVAPMEYLLGWRMALAKDLLRRERVTLAEVAERVGYGSASAFSVAFTRHVGVAPGRFARETGRFTERNGA